MKGFVVIDHYGRWDELTEKCGAWIRDDQIQILEDRAEGLENAASEFCRLMRGENFGKSLVVVGPETES